ncbi:MAG TPA: peptidoglycan-binding protein [Solirubrobacteraceae bacterium]|nr:peptidoglycan-binding protein [Solirubrobacteraceae bacterium]
MHRTARSSRPALPADDGWAIFALPPGERDLGRTEYWEASEERSRRRREAASRPLLARGPGAKVSVALAAAAIGGPVATGAAGAERAAASTSRATSASLGLARGSTGALVRALQQRLGIPADGIFGPRTLRAVKAFQRSHGIPSTGFVGTLTTRALGSLDAAGTAGSAGSARSGTRRDAAIARRISMDAGVARAMQRALGVAADGVVGPRTIAAVRAFQAAHGLTVDGVPGPATLRALGVSGPAAAPRTTSGTTTFSAPGSGAQAAVSAAMSKIGAPYRYGATGPSSFDCSGLVTWAMRQAGISVPRTSFAQYGIGTRVSSGQIQAGDLVFFDTAGPGASDVGLATSPTSAVSATTHGVMVHPILSGYWGSHFVGARRVA